jgi:hypothetical protein
VDAVLTELPERAWKRFTASPEELRIRIEQRIRVYDGADVDIPVAPSAPEPESTTPLNSPEQISSETSSPVGSLRLYVAAAIITAVVTYSAVLLWR